MTLFYSFILRTRLPMQRFAMNTPFLPMKLRFWLAFHFGILRQPSPKDLDELEQWLKEHPEYLDFEK